MSVRAFSVPHPLPSQQVAADKSHALFLHVRCAQLTVEDTKSRTFFFIALALVLMLSVCFVCCARQGSDSALLAP